MLVSEFIDRTLAEWLHPSGDERPQFDTLAEDLDTSETELELSGRTERVPRSAILEIGEEQILVTGASGSVVTDCERGYNGTTAAAHSTGDLVFVNPMFTRLEILNALRAITSKLGAWGLYERAVDTTNTFTIESVLTAPAGTRRIHSIAVRRSTSDELYSELTTPGDDWIELRYFTPLKFQIMRSVAAEGQDMYVVVFKDFTLPDAEADDLSADCGLSEEIQEDLPMAVAGQVLKGREVPRVTMDRIREALSAAGLNPGITLNIGESMIRSFRADAVMAERQRMELIDPTTFEWVRR